MADASRSLWTTQDVAEFLNVRPTRIYELVFARQIPFIKVGPRQLRFDPNVIQQWLDDRSAAGDTRRSDVTQLARTER